MQRLKLIPYFAILALLVYMPFHVFIAQSVSLATSGLDAWKIGKDVVLLITVMFTICLVLCQRKGDRTLAILLAFTALYGGIHILLWVFNRDIHVQSALIGTTYNMRLPLYALLGYTSVLLWSKFAFSSILKVVIGVSTVVALLGVVQYFLPSDILTHIGYGVDRGARAAFYIDNNTAFPRVMSTLRDPNSLAAYLLLPTVALLVYVIRAKDIHRRLLLGGALSLHILAILLTFSRSAWLGIGIAGILAIWWCFRRSVLTWARSWGVAVIIVVGVVAVGLYGFRNNPSVQQYVLHTSAQEEVDDIDSNEYHWLLVRDGLNGVVDRPLGHGPGTAGLASIQNPGGARLTENYYVQLGYELGVPGLIVFALFGGWVYLRLWRQDAVFSKVLCAAFWGYVAMNMLLHTWSNEAVAAQWWLLAGMVMGFYSRRPQTHKL